MNGLNFQHPFVEEQQMDHSLGRAPPPTHGKSILDIGPLTEYPSTTYSSVSLDHFFYQNPLDTTNEHSLYHQQQQYQPDQQHQEQQQSSGFLERLKIWKKKPGSGLSPPRAAGGPPVQFQSFMSYIKSSLVKIWFRKPVLNADHKKTLWILVGQLLFASLLLSFNWGECVLYPFHLIGVFFHEFGHAFMAVLTGGRILQIRIGREIDGSTVFAGGRPCLILPSGYLGSSFIGSLMVFSAFSIQFSLVLSWGLALVFLITLFYSAEVFTSVVAGINLGVFLILILVVGKRKDNILRYVISMMGILSCIFSIFDISRGLVFSTNTQSDAYKFSTQCFYCHDRIIGGVWLLISALLIFSSVYFSLKVFPFSFKRKILRVFSPRSCPV